MGISKIPNFYNQKQQKSIISKKLWYINIKMKTIQIPTKQEIIEIAKEEVNKRVIPLEREIDKLRIKISDLEQIQELTGDL